ncbi:MAG: hypothetical protein ACXU7H_09240 [Burkholderiaceae bacterium]
MKIHIVTAAFLLVYASLALGEEGQSNESHVHKHQHAAGMESDAPPDSQAVNEHPEDSGHQHDMRTMHGAYGTYALTREASGTSWQPDSTPHEGIHEMKGDWSTMVHGFADVIYDRQGGPRGDSKTFSSSMLMVMAQRDLEIGTLGLRGMLSLDPLMGKRGYPELFQTGETADGTTHLTDRQHPHDLLMELAVTYSVPLTRDSSVFAYVGLPGEPALGPAAFMHRFSGVDNPEAPISHHWLDSTHVTFGVTTIGYIYQNWKLEGSAFRGREPDQYRYNIDSGKLDSHSVRLTYNPTPNWSGQISYGHITSPEALEPDVNVNRTTASVTANFPYGANNWQTILAWGRNAPSTGNASNAYLLESTLTMHHLHTFFGRAEVVDKDELFANTPASPLAGQSFKIGKVSAGYIYDLPVNGHYTIGIGGLLSKYSVPSALASTYGSNPTSGMLFVRMKIR